MVTTRPQPPRSYCRGTVSAGSPVSENPLLLGSSANGGRFWRGANKILRRFYRDGTRANLMRRARKSKLTAATLYKIPEDLLDGEPEPPVEPPSPVPTPTPSPTPTPNPDPETPPEPREPKPDTPEPSPDPIRVPPPDTPPPGPGEPAVPLPTTSPIPPLPPSSEGAHCQRLLS
jgi:hypothetical protein